MTDTDRIEKHVVLRAPRSRVWKAITDAGEFGTWFHANLDGAFAEGEIIRGRMTEPGYEHMALEMRIEKIEPPSYFAYRWHPDAEQGGADFAADPTTLVEFRLDEVPEGTRLTIVESGFDALPQDKRDAAYRGNEKGWAYQLGNVARYVDGE